MRWPCDMLVAVATIYHRYAATCTLVYGAVDAIWGHPYLQTMSSDYANMQSIQLCYPKELI